METPTWITSDLVQRFLADSGEQVAEYVVESATKLGDNFLSHILRVKVVTKSGAKINLMLKIEDPNSADYITVLQAFPKEVAAYQDYIPAFEQLWKEHTGEVISFGPKCYYTENEPVPMIVMEDLGAQGYSTRDRLAGLDAKDLRIILEKVAKYHACSVKRYEENGSYDAEMFTDGLARPHISEIVQAYYSAMYEGFIWSVEHNVDNGAQFLPKLLKLRDKQFQIFHELTRADPEKFAVLSHSDLWVNNILFKGSSASEDVDVKFIDFQISQWSSPVIDLLFLLFTSGQGEVIANEGDQLIEFYHSKLVKAVERLNCRTKAPSLEELWEDLRKRGPLACCYIMETMALCRTDPSLNVSPALLTADSPEADKTRKAVFSGQEYVNTINWLLPYMVKKGFLNIA